MATYPAKWRREDIYLAVWMHTVQCEVRNTGFLTTQGQLELDEACETMREAERDGFDIPSISATADYYNRI